MRGSLLSITAIVALAAAFTSPAAAGATSTGGAEAASTATASSGGVSYATLPPEAESKPKKKATPKKKRRKGKAKRKRRRPVAPVTPPVTDVDHVFPVQGPFSLGGKDSRFGAGRPGHVHQGQDLSAPLGTPVVSPWAGTVEVVKYQAGGAGYYVVVDGDGDGEDRDYVFMHLRKGSILVERGQAVGKGQQLAQVGSTGSSSGPHLHFEIWVEGGWYTGGRPVDPLPFLQAWL